MGGELDWVRWNTATEEWELKKDYFKWGRSLIYGSYTFFLNYVFKKRNLNNVN